MSKHFSFSLLQLDDLFIYKFGSVHAYKKICSVLVVNKIAKSIDDVTEVRVSKYATINDVTEVCVSRFAAINDVTEVHVSRYALMT